MLPLRFLRWTWPSPTFSTGDGPRGGSTTTRNQINENSLAKENFLGGLPVVYWGRLHVIIGTANAAEVAGVLNGTA